MREAIKVVIIGAGPAGIAAAEELAAFGTETILICASQVGGRAGHSTLVPSKVMLDAAEHNELSGKLLSLEDFATLQNRLGETLRAYNGAKEDQVRLAGVEILHGKASFESRSRIKVVSDSGTTFIDFDRAIIATGSNAVFPPGIEPDGERILAPKMIKHLKAPPKDVIVVGAGVTGAEFTYAFLGMGSKVTWIADRFGILPNFDPSLVDSLTKSLERRGVEIISGMAAKTAENLGDRVRVTLDDGRKFEADIVMVGTGRRSDTDDLNLNAAGIRLSECEDSPGAIETDGYSCTNVNNIFAAGNVTGAPMMSNRAAAQGHTAAMLAMGEETAELINSTWGGAVFSRPQIAQVGVTPAVAKKR
ncbi:NAD(P)/FAD-dependent oxidoreductase, partial [Myxococcota bacterium]|nr:NAD(P)/FAD-dependent oxidoreductase [Myxococcota bacterium]